MTAPPPGYAAFVHALVGDGPAPADDTPLGALPAGDYALLARLDDAVRIPPPAAEAELVVRWHSLTLPEVYTLICPDPSGAAPS